MRQQRLASILKGIAVLKPFSKKDLLLFCLKDFYAVCTFLDKYARTAIRTSNLLYVTIFNNLPALLTYEFTHLNYSAVYAFPVNLPQRGHSNIPLPMRFATPSHFGHFCSALCFLSTSAILARILRPYLGPVFPPSFFVFSLIFH